MYSSVTINGFTYYCESGKEEEFLKDVYDNIYEFVEEWVYFDGHNDDDVAKFCSRHQYSLCAINSRFKNLITNEDTLFIEPSDTMRGRGLNIPKFSIAYKEICSDLIKVRSLTEKEMKFKIELEKLVIDKTSGYQKAELRMNKSENGWYVDFYLIDLNDAPYEWHGGTEEYEIDFNKSFLENLIDIKCDISKNGIELEW